MPTGAGSEPADWGVQIPGKIAELSDEEKVKSFHIELMPQTERGLQAIN
jgi:hypothetical protein